MATIIDEHIPNKSTSWENYAGQRVEEYIKEQFETKAGFFFYDSTTNRYVVFADSENYNIWALDRNRTDLIIASFDAPANYTMSIDISSEINKAILVGTTGQYIVFTPTVESKDGNPVYENVNITYTFRRGTNTVVAYAVTTSGTEVTINIDKYLQSGTNTITIQCTGQGTFAASAASVQYVVVDLKLTDNFDISRTVTPTGTLSVPYTVSGSGQKIMEFYIDGSRVPLNQAEDVINNPSDTRTKNITLSTSEGQHHLQLRAKVTINDQAFYSNTLYREFVVAMSSGSTIPSPIVVTKGEIPSGQSLIPSGGHMTYSITQYIPYSLDFAVYNPSSATTAVKIQSGSTDTYNASLPTLANLTATNGEVQTFTYTSTSNGNVYLFITAGSVHYVVPFVVEETDMDLEEITNALDLEFDARGRSNNESRPNDFSFTNSYGTTYNGAFTGFDWNDTSGWNEDSLLIPSGASFAITNYKPFTSEMTTDGYTLELEFSTESVSNDDASICNMAGNDNATGHDTSGYMNATGMYITATSASIACTSWLGNDDKEGRQLRVRFRDKEYIRISFVINRLSGSSDQLLAMVYINGRISGAKPFATTDSFASNKYIRFTSDGCAIRLRYIRGYKTALSAEQILNNYILYRTSLDDMRTIYDRNDIYDQDNNLDVDVLANYTPVMMITGPLNVLENTTDKKELIQVDEILYTNMQDPTRSFRMTDTGMTPQGTSSMSYPKKNFRIYTLKYYANESKLYDYEGNEVQDKLYAFKQGSIPVPTWCLKADYAESSSSHNTGVARLWNELLKQARITFDATDYSGSSHSVSNAYALRTNAQISAITNNYLYDVRTCIDGFPIVLFYRPTEQQDYIFMGKYNFNNDKSTENVFGFKDIPGFDNTHMQCWEVLNNGNDIALFRNVTDFYTTMSDGSKGWQEAFESRYPDTSSPTNTLGDLYSFCQWISAFDETSSSDADSFATAKWAHLDVYKVAAYYVYLMVFGAVDQTTKNAMLTSEDGQHFYYINYDNDTILGVRNDGVLAFPPTIDRQSYDNTTTQTGIYAYAGHNNKLWNMLEPDPEFQAIVRSVYGSLYEAGMTYENMIDMFDNKQSESWCERIFNLDAEYKYLAPYRSGQNRLSMLQGSRSSHRKWWLSQRFAIYDAKYVSGEYRNRVIEFKVLNDTPSGQSFSITAGKDFYYGYGVNAIVISSGVYRTAGQTATFSTTSVLNLGDPVRIYGAYYVKGVDLSSMTSRVSEVHLENVNSSSLGNMLEDITIGSSSVNSGITELSGLADMQTLKTLNLQRCVGLTSLDLSNNVNLTSLEARGSHLSYVDFGSGSKVSYFGVPSYLTTLTLTNAANIVLYSYTQSSKTYGCVFETTNGTNINDVTISGCMKDNASGTNAYLKSMRNSWNWVKAWYNGKTSTQKALAHFTQNYIIWRDVDVTELIALKDGRSGASGMGSRLTLLGEIHLSNETITSEQAQTLQTLFGQNCFSSNADLQIIPKNAIMYFSGDTSMVEGDSEHIITFYVISESGGRLQINTNTNSHSNVTFNPSSVNTTTEKTASFVVSATEVASGSAYDISLSAYWTPTGGSLQGPITHTISVAKATYPAISNITSINGSSRLNTTGNKKTNFSITPTIEELRQTYTGTFGGRWSVSGDLSSYVSVDSSNSSCVITVTNTNVDYATGVLTFTLWKHPSGGEESVIGTKTMNIAILSNDIAVSAITNQPLMTALWSRFGQNVSGARPYDSNGHYLQHQDYITKEEAALFETDTEHTPVSSPTWASAGYGFYAGTTYNNGFFYNWRNTLTSFAEFKWFTGVTKIPSYFFCNCSKLAEFEFHENVTHIYGYSFGVLGSSSEASTTAGLQGEITISPNVIYVGGDAFSSNGRITKLTIPGITTWYAMKGMSNCTHLYLPEVTTIGEAAFGSFHKLEYIYAPKVTSWSGHGFDSYNNSTGCARDAEHPELVIGSLAPAARYWCRSLAPKWKLTLSVYCTSIGGCLLSPDSGEYPFTEFSVESGNNVFAMSNGCVVDITTQKLMLVPNVEEVTLPSTATSVYYTTIASSGCHPLFSLYKLKRLHIPASYTQLYMYGLKGLEHVDVDSGNTVYDSRNNCNAIMITSGNKLYRGSKNTVIPSETASIEQYAFAVSQFNNGGTGVLDLSSFSSLTSIAQYAFSYCSGITQLTVPNVSSIGHYAFQYMSNLTRAVFNYTKRADQTFQGCSNLVYAEIGNTVNVGNNFFTACLKLQTIVIRATTMPTINSTNSFGTGTNTAGYTYRTSGNNKLYVPSSLITTYQSNSNVTANLLNASYGGYSVVDISTLVE